MALVEEMLREAKVSTGKVLRLHGEVLTSERMISEVELFLKRKGLTATRTIVACGPASAQPHNTGSGPIRAGQPVIADIFPRDDASGYWGDMTRTFVKGRAPAVVKRAFEAVEEARDEAKKIIKAGVPADRPHKLAFDLMAAKGFETGRDPKGNPCGFIHGLGHGVGLEIHEAPRVSPMNKRPLEKGTSCPSSPASTIRPGAESASRISSWCARAPANASTSSIPSWRFRRRMASGRVFSEA
jgi:Xaa-Pro aminopeptidase